MAILQIQQQQSKQYGAMAWSAVKLAWSKAISLIKYLLSFMWVVHLVRWLIKVGGNIAESSFLLATLYVTVEVVAHKLVSWLVSDNIISGLNQISIIVFTILPELIVFAAIATTFDHFKMALRNRKRLDMWAWAIAYLIPTSVFLIMTVWTISSFVSLEAISADTFQASGTTLVIRTLAGWFYGMVSMLFDQLGKKGYTHTFDQQKEKIAELEADSQKNKQDLEQIQAAFKALQADYEASLNNLKVLRVEMASLRVRKQETKSNTSPENNTLEKSNTSPESDISEKEDTGKRAILKKTIREALAKSDKLNYREIEKAAGVSYSMVRQHAPKMLAELQEEMTPLHVV